MSSFSFVAIDRVTVINFYRELSNAEVTMRGPICRRNTRSVWPVANCHEVSKTIRNQSCSYDWTVFVFIFSNTSRACCVSQNSFLKMYKMLYRKKVESHPIKIVFAPILKKSCGLILVFSRSQRAGACAAFSVAAWLGLEASVDRARRDQRDSGGCNVTRPRPRETPPHVT